MLEPIAAYSACSINPHLRHSMVISRIYIRSRHILISPDIIGVIGNVGNIWYFSCTKIGNTHSLVVGVECW